MADPKAYANAPSPMSVSTPMGGDKADRCALCGMTATGYAFVNDLRYCHGDDDPSPSCYERAVVLSANGR